MGKRIKPSDAKKLCNNFDDKYKELSKFIKKDDNRSVLFSIQEIQDYIEYVKKENPTVDGLRVYLGSNKKTKMTTVFFAPTTNGKDDISLDALNYGIAGDPKKLKYGK